MRQVQVFTRKTITDKSNKTVVTKHDRNQAITVPVPHYKGVFHQFITLATEDGESWCYALIENDNGIMSEVALSDMQFLTDPGGVKNVHVGATHVVSNNHYYRYGKNGNAQKCIACDWVEPHIAVTNYDLYSQKDKYIPL